MLKNMPSAQKNRKISFQDRRNIIFLWSQKIKSFLLYNQESNPARIAGQILRCLSYCKVMAMVFRKRGSRDSTFLVFAGYDSAESN